MKLMVLGLSAVLLAGPAVAVAASLEDTYQSLKNAVASKDVAQVKKLVADLNPLIKAELAEPNSSGNAEEKQASAARLDFVKSVAEYSEYALFATALQAEPADTIDLVAMLERQNPKSKYLDQAYGTYLVALDTTKATAKIPAIAEKALVNFPENPDLLLALMNDAANRKQNEKALAYANRLTAALPKRVRPENISAEDWEKTRNDEMGRGYWEAGVLYATKGQYLLSDKKLRAALPLIKGNDAMMGPALFYLGMMDYQLARMTNNKKQLLEAAEFSQQAAAVDSPYADQARHNAQVMKNEAAGMR